MGTTATYALRYPGSTDDVKPYEDVQFLGEDVDLTLLTKFGVIARWTRTSSKVCTGTEAPTIRIDNLALLAGVYYTIETDSLDFALTAGETAVAIARLSTAGAATVASAQIGAVQASTNAAFTPRQGAVLVAEYAPVGNVTASVLLSINRTGGSNNVTLNGSATQPIVLMVKAWGKAVTPSGVDL